MDGFEPTRAGPSNVHAINRRTVIRGAVISGAVATFAVDTPQLGQAQETTPAPGQCVATAPPTENGVGLATLFAGGIVDMPAGPVRVGIYRFTLEPGASVPPAASPNPSLMYIEAGESTCPGNPGKRMYDADGSVMYETTGEAESHTCPTGTTWYIPGGIEDAALNEGNTLMSSLILEFVSVTTEATPTT